MTHITNFNAKNFIRDIYLAATPSVDLETVEGQVDCTKHTLPISVCDKVYADHDLEPFKGDGYDNKRDDLRFSCNMWLLNSGPQLVQG